MREQEKVLFQNWSVNRPNFILDGVIDEQSYKESLIKVLYILKDPNGGKGWDLRELLKDGGPAMTWNNIARWQYGIANYTKVDLWNNIRNITKKFRKEQLNKIAVMNLKKDSGGSTAKMNEIWMYAWNDRINLRKQIEIYKPDIIICCGTGEVVRERELIHKFDKNEWITSSSGVQYYIKKNGEKNQIIVSFCHPAIRSKASDKFEDLINTIKDIKSLG